MLSYRTITREDVIKVMDPQEDIEIILNYADWPNPITSIYKGGELSLAGMEKMCHKKEVREIWSLAGLDVPAACLKTEAQHGKQHRWPWGAENGCRLSQQGKRECTVPTRKELNSANHLNEYVSWCSFRVSRGALRPPTTLILALWNPKQTNQPTTLPPKKLLTYITAR